MAGAELVEDGKWYNLSDALDREDYLVSTQPTGETWRWINKSGEEVIIGRCRRNGNG